MGLQTKYVWTCDRCGAEVVKSSGCRPVLWGDVDLTRQGSFGAEDVSPTRVLCALCFNVIEKVLNEGPE